MTGRRRPGRDRGSSTVELAVGLPTLIAMLLTGLAFIAAVTAKGQCLDAAREGVLAGSRGEPAVPAAARVGPAGAEVEVTFGEKELTVKVRTRVRVLGSLVPAIPVEVSVVGAREPDEIGAIG